MLDVWVLFEQNKETNYTRCIGLYLSEADAKDMSEIQKAFSENHTYYWEHHTLNEKEFHE